ncbi:hypothetical protein [Roseimicrobium sp. ORNL1]|uniref:hypothetical protein n=1 Tax=Roseimicrobium sp. ORNL1 TaxID=2711231 RepID=UPI0013E13D33|nr:hypothetical protein [Roseimicrobium sp. ORNL1]QIF05293.1 hypothetical protein G5S37_28560 [Roseimicrobium sp. ORNL1]
METETDTVMAAMIMADTEVTVTTTAGMGDTITMVIMATDMADTIKEDTIMATVTITAKAAPRSISPVSDMYSFAGKHVRQPLESTSQFKQTKRNAIP